jgi:(p)ppGpp synthase/HD superfamily hydrolase
MNLQKAIEIAVEAHAHQKDKVGKPYLLHVFSVMARGKSDDEKIVALLHDVVEDTDRTLSDLDAAGFAPHILAAVDALTKRHGEPYNDFIERVKQNPLAVKVKINDLEDNMDIKRLPLVAEKDVERLNRYLKAYRDLTATDQ